MNLNIQIPKQQVSTFYIDNYNHYMLLLLAFLHGNINALDNLSKFHV